MNNINFGKAIKVNAPFNSALKIAQIANGCNTPNEQANLQIRQLIDDVDFGKARACHYDKDVSYIFSGDEGNKFWDLYNLSIDMLKDENEPQIDTRKKDKDEYIDDEYVFQNRINAKKVLLTSKDYHEINVNYLGRTKEIAGIDIII
ncbi:hypothetical protein IJ182_04640 [bacterium]|nr:hypothetical protein [bacterium]